MAAVYQVRSCDVVCVGWVAVCVDVRVYRKKKEKHDQNHYLSTIKSELSPAVSCVLPLKYISC